MYCDRRTTKSYSSSTPAFKKSPSRSTATSGHSGDSSREQAGQSSRRDTAAAKKPQQRAQERRWRASPPRQRPNQAPAGHLSSSASSKDDDTDGEAGPRDHHQSVGDREPAEQEPTPTAASDGDSARPEKDDEKSERPDGVVTKNGYIRIIRVVGKYRSVVCTVHTRTKSTFKCTYVI